MKAAQVKSLVALLVGSIDQHAQHQTDDHRSCEEYQRANRLSMLRDLIFHRLFLVLEGRIGAGYD